jgi:hypothetical protein
MSSIDFSCLIVIGQSEPATARAGYCWVEPVVVMPAGASVSLFCDMVEKALMIMRKKDLRLL